MPAFPHNFSFMQKDTVTDNCKVVKKIFLKILNHGRDWRGGEAVAKAMERVGSRGTPESP